MDKNKIIIKKIDKIIIEKRFNKRKFSFEIEADEGLHISKFYKGFYGDISSKEIFKWQDIFSEGTRMLIMGLFENIETGNIYEGTYDAITDELACKIKGVII